LAFLCSFIVHRQGGIEIDIDTAGQRLQALDETSIHKLQPLGMAGEVGSQEAEELAEHRVVAVRCFGAREHHLSAGANGVMNLVALTQLEGTTDGLRHRGLVAISEGGFGFESRGHGRSPADQGCCTHGNASALLRQAQVRFYVLPYEIHATSGIAAIGDRLWEVWIPSAQFKTCGATDLQGLGDLGQRQELRGWLASGRLNQYLASTVSVCITIGGGLGVRNWAWRIHGEFLKPLTQNLPGVC